MPDWCARSSAATTANGSPHRPWPTSSRSATRLGDLRDYVEVFADISQRKAREDELLRCADSALYKAKRSDRKRVEAWFE